MFLGNTTDMMYLAFALIAPDPSFPSYHLLLNNVNHPLVYKEGDSFEYCSAFTGGTQYSVDQLDAALEDIFKGYPVTIRSGVYDLKIYTYLSTDVEDELLPLSKCVLIHSISCDHKTLQSFYLNLKRGSS